MRIHQTEKNQSAVDIEFRWCCSRLNGINVFVALGENCVLATNQSVDCCATILFTIILNSAKVWNRGCNWPVFGVGMHMKSPNGSSFKTEIAKFYLIFCKFYFTHDWFPKIAILWCHQERARWLTHTYNDIIIGKSKSLPRVSHRK